MVVSHHTIIQVLAHLTPPPTRPHVPLLTIVPRISAPLGLHPHPDPLGWSGPRCRVGWGSLVCCRLSRRPILATDMIHGGWCGGRRGQSRSLLLSPVQ